MKLREAIAYLNESNYICIDLDGLQEVILIGEDGTVQVWVDAHSSWWVQSHLHVDDLDSEVTTFNVDGLQLDGRYAIR